MMADITCPKNTFLGRDVTVPGVPKRIAVLAPKDAISSVYPRSNAR